MKREIKRWEKVQIIVAFGDIRDHTEQGKNIDDDKNNAFSERYDFLISALQKKTGYFVKQIGDGFMMVAELNAENDSSRVSVFLKAILDFSEKVHLLIKKYRLKGYRIRIGAGKSKKKNKEGGLIDYESPTCDQTHKLLHFEKHIPILIDSNAKDLIPDGHAKTLGFHFTHLKPIDRRSAGINPETLREIWVMEKR